MEVRSNVFQCVGHYRLVQNPLAWRQTVDHASPAYDCLTEVSQSKPRRVAQSYNWDVPSSTELQTFILDAGLLESVQDTVHQGPGRVTHREARSQSI